ncbi:hypothetical protein MMC21_003090 [Puttea exsequens]|nr:hypothetical protein [Puttea exsequens]
MSSPASGAQLSDLSRETRRGMDDGVEDEAMSSSSFVADHQYSDDNYEAGNTLSRLRYHHVPHRADRSVVQPLPIEYVPTSNINNEESTNTVHHSSQRLGAASARSESGASYDERVSQIACPQASKPTMDTKRLHILAKANGIRPYEAAMMIEKGQADELQEPKPEDP